MTEWHNDNQDISGKVVEGYHNTVYATANIINEAPVFVLVYRNTTGKGMNSDVLAIGACVQNMCLKARDIGLDTLWIGDTRFVREKIDRFLKIKNMQLVTSVAIGYRNTEPYDVPRKPLDEVMLDNIQEGYVNN